MVYDGPPSDTGISRNFLQITWQIVTRKQLFSMRQVGNQHDDTTSKLFSGQTLSTAGV